MISMAITTRLASFMVIRRRKQYFGHVTSAAPNLCKPIAMAEAVLVNGKIHPKRTKAMDIRFHWL
jgi:hypothetical protein